MQITLKLYAMLTQYLPKNAENNQVSLDISAETSVADVINKLNMPDELVHLVLLNGVYIQPEQLAETHFSDADVLAIWPPVAGG